ncbi:hypothetical protein BDV32DRAFT_138591 [Aspergillus pseudonomiae]|nr:hypothetical protein BDV32DRAFT_138591 [Aspergillus pseudonomiae]
MAESPASIMKLSLPLANEDLGRLIRRIEQHCPSENTLTVTFSQEHVQFISVKKASIQILTLQKASQVHVNDGAITKPIAKTRRVKSMQEHESISCAMVRCTYIHGLKVSCPKILTDRGCVTLFLSRLSPSYCQFGHDHRAARLFNYKEGSACHGVLNLETKKKRRLAGPGPAGFGLVPRAGAI